MTKYKLLLYAMKKPLDKMESHRRYRATEEGYKQNGEFYFINLFIPGNKEPIVMI